MLFSHVKISSFRAKAHLVFHWCLYNKLKFSIKQRTKVKTTAELRKTRRLSTTPNSKREAHDDKKQVELLTFRFDICLNTKGLEMAI